MSCIPPIFVSLSSEMAQSERNRVARQSILTGFLVGVAFLGAGKSAFALLGITVPDFQIAGGILLFIISIVDLIFPEKTRTFPEKTQWEWKGLFPIAGCLRHDDAQSRITRMEGPHLRKTVRT